MNPFERRALDGLTWWPERGMGYFPVRSNGVYDLAYFQKYQAYAATAQGRAITRARAELVIRHLGWEAWLLDVGIGCGAFLEHMRKPQDSHAFGFDVNPAGVNWLMDKGWWSLPDENRGGWDRSWQAMTFWDSLEHIPEPTETLLHTEWAFMTLPIFTGPDHVLHSKHFRRNEHYWYFTRRGLVDWMASQGFTCIEHNTMEQLLEREDVDTFVFRRQ